MSDRSGRDVVFWMEQLPPVPPVVPRGVRPPRFVLLRRRPSLFVRALRGGFYCVGVVAATMVVSVVMLAVMGHFPRLVDQVGAFVSEDVVVPRSVVTSSVPEVARVSAASSEDLAAGRVTQCSGFFVSATRLVTAAHCLLPDSGPPVEVSVFPGAFRGSDGEVSPLGPCTAVSWRVHPEYLALWSVDPGAEDLRRWDVATVDVGECWGASSFKHPPSFFGLGLPANWESRSVSSLSYPGDELPGTLVASSGDVLSCWACEEYDAARTSFDITPGSSGGVVFSNRDGVRHAVGVWTSVGPMGSFFRVLDDDLVRFIRG